MGGVLLGVAGGQGVQAYRGNDEGEPGVYLGIIGFSDALDVKEIERLTPGNQRSFEQKIDNLRLGRSTALYYAIDHAVRRMETAELPDDLSSVTLVTFTDGFDNISTLFQDAKRETGRAYEDYISNLLSSSSVHGVELRAYSIGLIGEEMMGDGEATVLKFKRMLRSISSSSDLAVPITRKELAWVFAGVAEDMQDTMPAKQGSALVMLVLDCSGSMLASLEALKIVAKQFVEILAEGK